VHRETPTMNTAIADSPASNAVDSFAMGPQGEDVCTTHRSRPRHYPQVNCTKPQKGAGVTLFRTVLDRINAI
jgi:hypothetical protein